MPKGSRIPISYIFKNISRISTLLTTSTATTLTQITITSLKSVLTDLPAFIPSSLLRAANLIWLKPELDCVTSLLKTLSFPISLKLKAKIFTRLYKSVHDLDPLWCLIFSPATLSLISSTLAILTSLLYME